MRHFDHELLGVLSGESRGKAMGGVQVERFLHAFEGAHDRDDIVGLVAHIRRFGVLPERSTQALEEATRWYERRKTTHFGCATRGNTAHSVGKRPDCRPHIDGARGGVRAERPGTRDVSGGAGPRAPGGRSNFFDRVPLARA